MLFYRLSIHAWHGKQNNLKYREKCMKNESIESI